MSEPKKTHVFSTIKQLQSCPPFSVFCTRTQESIEGHHLSRVWQRTLVRVMLEPAFEGIFFEANPGIGPFSWKDEWSFYFGHDMLKKDIAGDLMVLLNLTCCQGTSGRTAACSIVSSNPRAKESCPPLSHALIALLKPQPHWGFNISDQSCKYGAPKPLWVRRNIIWNILELKHSI